MKIDQQSALFFLQSWPVFYWVHGKWGDFVDCITTEEDESAPLFLIQDSIQESSVYGVEWSDFWKKFGHMAFCSRLFWDLKSNILLWSVAFSHGAGPHKASVNPKKA